MSLNLKVPLTATESLTFQAQFSQLDREGLGVATGEALRPLLASSGVAPQLLSQVWGLVDTNNKGFLNYTEFAAAMRCIGLLQQYPGTPVNQALYDNPLQVMPVLSGAGASAPAPATGASTIPLPSPSDVAKFYELFDRTAGGAPDLTGDKAKDIFLKARLPNQTLGEIWGLCDRNASGALDKQEFTMAMYLIQLAMAGSPALNPLPSVLDQSLWTAVSNGPAASAPAQGYISANNTGNSSIRRQNTITRLSSGAFNNASNDWVLTPDKKRQFDAIFASLDKQHAGKLSSQVLVPFFLSSKLSQETLASVWDLADIHNNAEFSNLEFAIAMFLIQKKNAGIDLPDVVPNELLQSPALGLYPQQQGGAPAPIPSRATKPSFQDSTTQQQAPVQVPQLSNNGSLNDLMALNNTFSPSPVQPMATNDTNNSMGSGSGIGAGTAQHSSMNMKKFNPTSNFGQTIIREEEEEHSPFVGGAAAAAIAPGQQAQAQAPQPPMQRAASVTLPQVPNFGSLNLTGGNAMGNAALGAGAAIGAAAGAVGSRAFSNNDLYADANASAQLSSATTEMANLSNQMNSLSKQATMTNDKKGKATQELARVNDLKKSLTMKLSTLRSTHEQNVKQVEQLGKSLATTKGENDQLQQQLALVEANYHAIETKLNETNEESQQAQDENNRLKEQIKNLNIQAATLQSQLDQKQQEVKQQRSMVDVNAKQLELSQVTVANFTTEIAGLDEKLQAYLGKKKELDDYEQTIQEKHTQLETRYNELTEKENDINQRDAQLKEHTQQIEEQEQVYHDQVARLQTMFTELSQRKEAFDKADDELKQQHMEYANNVQDLAERQMNLAMGELPDDAKDIVEKNKMNKSVVPEANGDGAASAQNEAISDRFEGDLNEYGIPRTESLTSSVANNAPQSTTDDIERVENLDSRIGGPVGAPSAAAVARGTGPAVEGTQAGSVSSTSEAGVLASAGATSDSQTMVNGIPQKDDDASDAGSALSHSDSDNSIQQSPVAANPERTFEEAIDNVDIPASTAAPAIDEEFPPIRELEIDESDSSDDDEDAFQDTKDVITPSMQNVSKPVATPAPKDEFDDEFAGLEQANVEEDAGSDEETTGATDAMEHFQSAEDGFTGTEVAAPQPQQIPQQAPQPISQQPQAVPQQQQQQQQQQAPLQPNVTNDEWDEIFAGFGNGKETPSMPQVQSHAPPQNALQQPTPDRNSMPAGRPHANRAMATTPKALAVEELSGMGFTEAEATKALEECNWDLETATNYLLDSA